MAEIAIDKVNIGDKSKSLTDFYGQLILSSKSNEVRGQQSTVLQTIMISLNPATTYTLDPVKSNITANASCYNSVFNNYNVSNFNCNFIPDYARSPPPLNKSALP
jgi:hypothetical protein